MERKKIKIENVNHKNRISHLFIVETIEMVLKSFVKTEFIEYTTININTDNSKENSISNINISFVSDYANTETIKNRITDLLFNKKEN